MKRIAATLATIAVVAAAAWGGYWYGTRGDAALRSAVGVGQEAVASSGAADSAPAGASTAGGKERKILYYRNPMGLPDTSPVPKKDQMGMDYIPVYSDDGPEQEDAAGGLRISTAKIQKLGVRTETVVRKALARTVSATGRVEPDERLTYAIAPKFEGYVEKLHVNVTGQPVSKGQSLFEVYSPEIASAQREYAIAAAGARSMREAGDQVAESMKRLTQASLARLRNWDISDEQLRALERSGEATRTVTFRSPVSGVVTSKKALQGMRFMPGEMLYEVTDLSRVWVIADVFEQDIGAMRTGARATVRVNSYPDKEFRGTITYIYPTLSAATRTVPVRIELANPGQLLKPAMFAQIDLSVGGATKVLVVPDSAVIDSGVRRVVLVDAGGGRFEPRTVRTGARSSDSIEILDGLSEGEQVVVAANFLIDAESNLKAALSSLVADQQNQGAASSAQAQPGSQAGTATVGHSASGKVESNDPRENIVTLTHGPVASLRWPAMTMEFQVANESLFKALRPGTKVDFEFVERKPGEWVITKARAAAAGQ